MSASFQVGPKGRACLPAAVRRAAQVPEGAVLVAHDDGDGRIVLETEHALRARVWAAAPAPSQLDTAVDVRALRDDDARTADDAAARRSRGGHDPDAGAALLEHLGL